MSAGSMFRRGLTRREALAAAGVRLGVAAAIPARAEGGLLRATRVDHVSLAVGDSHKAMLFYRRLFGNEVLKDNKTERRFLRLGPCYMAVASARAGEAKRIDHAALASRTSVVRGGAVVGLRTRVRR